MKSKLRSFIENYLKLNYEEFDDDIFPSFLNDLKKKHFKDTIKNRKKKHDFNYCKINIENRYQQGQ